jgi:hypothetical protein
MSRGPRYSEAEARKAVVDSLSYAEALRRLGMRPAGGNHQTLQKYVELWEIPTDHFDPIFAQRRQRRREVTPLEEVLVEHSTYSRGCLKRRLYATGLKQRMCELCGQGELWRGRRMALILDHSNGVGTDNRIENLRIVCPNCASTLDTHCGRNLRLVQDRVCEECGASYRPGTWSSDSARCTAGVTTSGRTRGSHGQRRARCRGLPTSNSRRTLLI